VDSIACFVDEWQHIIFRRKQAVEVMNDSADSSRRSLLTARPLKYYNIRMEACGKQKLEHI